MRIASNQIERKTLLGVAVCAEDRSRFFSFFSFSTATGAGGAMV